MSVELINSNKDTSEIDNNFTNIEDAKIESTTLNNPFAFSTEYLFR